MHTTIGIEIEAPAQRVFELARDIERWPQLLPHYHKVSVRSRQASRIEARMVAIRHFGPIPFPVTWRAEQWAEGDDPEDLRLRFQHVWGVTRGMRVTWHIRPTSRGADVTIEHDFRRGIPLIGRRLLPAFVDRFFTRPIAGRTLATFKRLAEQAGEPDMMGRT
jgi:ribosome-associated toxin RatA of RatAB toxin-antitoxin module